MIDSYRQDGEPLRRMITQRLQHHALPTDEPAHVVAGPSSGRFCAACCRYLSEREHEIRAIGRDGASTYFHPGCFLVTSQVRAARSGRKPAHAPALQALRALLGLKPREPVLRL